jgi:hypothetical protein
MQLGVLSGASYLTRPNRGSVAYSFHHLRRLRDPGFVNAPISVHSAGIPIVCSSVQEAEYAGTFGAAKIATGERQVLHDFGYPQRPTVIYCDNEVACQQVREAEALKVLRHEAKLASGPRGSIAVSCPPHPRPYQLSTSRITSPRLSRFLGTRLRLLSSPWIRPLSAVGLVYILVLLA